MDTNEKRINFYRELAERFCCDVTGNKLYLDPGCSLDNASARLGVSRHELSHAVNGCLGKNFSRLVNELRIAEAVRIMRSPQGRELKIHLIALMSGFNDRKNFMRVCKQITGKCPAQLKKQFNTYKL